MSKKTKSGKYLNPNNRGRKPGLGLILLIVLLLAAAAVILVLMGKGREPKPVETEPQALTETKIPETENPAAEETLPAMIATDEDINVNLNFGLYVTDIGGYTGMYMEDGSDEIVSNVLMLIVKNDGDQDVQYAEIGLELGEETAFFTLSTLPVGESVVLLEKNGLTWDETVDYVSALSMASNVAYFTEPMQLHSDKLKVQIVDGAINVTNISGEDIPGNISVYYKNAAADLLYGGITYRVTIEGGLKAEELRQVVTKHASNSGSRIMFITISQ